MALAATAAAAAVAAYTNAKFNIGADISMIRRFKEAERETQRAMQANRLSIWYQIEATCKKYWNERAIWTRERSWTFGELYQQSVRYATWLLTPEGGSIRPGDLVAVYLVNSAEFIMIWFACLCIGSAPAMINYHLEGKALLHCLGVCDAKVIIVDGDYPDCVARIEASREQIQSRGTKIVVHDEQFKRAILSRSADQVPGDELRKDVKMESPYCLIYTSGTTGFPKGCAFTTGRSHLLGQHKRPTFEAVPTVDCWYNAMPLYHGTGGITTSQALLGGIGVAIAPRFSVSRFWPDICDSGSTMFIYVGETARYLLNVSPPHPLERKHKIRCAYGNGLRPDVWEKMQTRFNIPQVAEFFNSTEGMFSLVNHSKGPFRAACVGFHGLILRLLCNNTYIPVLIDHDTGDIWRDPKTGFAKRMPYTVGGEILVRIPTKSAFQGYWKNPGATDKKFVMDVFQKGDCFYRTGDALRRDDDGRWFFLDRLGDTFRWKSENVSTAEVQECLGKFPGVAEANVYGVLVPSHEGRAGCAALDLTNDKDGESQAFFDNLLAYSRKQLPRYAVPVFLRLVKSSLHIHNHKQNKVPLRKEGVDPALLGTEAPDGKDDVILWLKDGRYQPFTRKDWAALQAAQVRL